MDRRARRVPSRLKRSSLPRILVASNIAGAAGQSIAGTASVLLAQHLAGTEYAGYPQALLAAGTAAATIALSRASQTWGRAVALAAGQSIAMGGAVAGVIAALTGSLIPLLVGSLLIGSGQAAVLLARYAAAEQVAPELRARAMGRILTATTIGAVLGPNLLQPGDALGDRMHLPALAGPYLVAILFFAAAALFLSRAPARIPQRESAQERTVGWSRHNFSGLAVLSVANLIMIAVMTMAPAHMESFGSGLTVIGAVVSIHIAGMSLPSSVSGFLTERLGGERVSIAAGLVLAVSCVWAATAQGSLDMAIAMLLLGGGWNLALLAGSALVTDGIPEVWRPRREGFGDASMGIAAAVGGISSGMLMQTGGYAALAVSGAVMASLVCAILFVTGRASTS